MDFDRKRDTGRQYDITPDVWGYIYSDAVVMNTTAIVLLLVLHKRWRCRWRKPSKEKNTLKMNKISLLINSSVCAFNYSAKSLTYVYWYCSFSDSLGTNTCMLWSVWHLKKNQTPNLGTCLGSHWLDGHIAWRALELRVALHLIVFGHNWCRSGKRRSRHKQ